MPSLRNKIDELRGFVDFNGSIVDFFKDCGLSNPYHLRELLMKDFFEEKTVNVGLTKSIPLNYPNCGTCLIGYFGHIGGKGILKRLILPPLGVVTHTTLAGVRALSFVPKDSPTPCSGGNSSDRIIVEEDSSIGPAQFQIIFGDSEPKFPLDIEACPSWTIEIHPEPPGIYTIRAEILQFG
jgi:hypothetical protein